MRLSTLRLLETLGLSLANSKASLCICESWPSPTLPPWCVSPVGSQGVGQGRAEDIWRGERRGFLSLTDP